MEILRPTFCSFDDALVTVLQGTKNQKHLNVLDEVLRREIALIPNNAFTFQITIVFRNLIQELSEFYKSSRMIRSQTFRSLENELNKKLSTITGPCLYPEGIIEATFDDCIVMAKTKRSPVYEKAFLPKFYIIFESVIRFQRTLSYHTETGVLLLETHLQTLVFKKCQTLQSLLRKPFPKTQEKLKAHLIKELQTNACRSEMDTVFLEILTKLFFRKMAPIYELATLVKMQAYQGLRESKLVPKRNALDYLTLKTHQTWQVFQISPAFPRDYLLLSIQRLEALYIKAKVPPTEKFFEVKRSLT